MKNVMIISMICTEECGDATFNYDLQIKPDTTLSEFINGILSDTKEWGCISVRKGGCPCLGIKGKLLMEIWYRHGDIESILAYDAPDDIKSRYIYEECKANGGWTRMDYTVTLKEEK